MLIMTRGLEPWLAAAGVAQLGVAIVNLGVVRLLRWKGELARLPLLMREVFQVHVWFISLTLAIFGSTTVRFARELAIGRNPALTWLAAAIAIFWSVRVVIQVAYYSASHWRGNKARLLIHLLLLVVYGGMALVYAMAAWGR